jgi:hypothetical protein
VTGVLKALTAPGVWTPVGGLPLDPVFVGPSQPGDEYSLWFDTDEVAGAVPLGVVAYAEVVANQTPITTVVDVTGCSVTFTAVTGRCYKVTGSLFPQSSVAADVIRMQITDAANAIKQLADVSVAAANAPVSLQRSWVTTTLSGSTTLKLRLGRQVGTGTVLNAAAGVWPSFILVEDMGVL